MKNTFTPGARLASALSLAALSLAFSAPAEAVIVNVGGTNYEVTTFNGNYINNVSRFGIDEMPWWGNQSLAASFASALWPIAPTPNGGLPGNLIGPVPLGPFFADSVNVNTSQVSISSALSSDVIFTGDPQFTDTYHYAVAQAVPVPFESNALPVVGATLFMAGGLWWKRKRNQAKIAEFVAEK